MILCAIATGCAKEDKGNKAAAIAAREGAVAPDFALKDIAGREVSLSSLKGKVVFLNFWATWCPPCKEEIPSMMKLNQAMAGKSFQMMAVSVDDGGKDAVVAFMNRNGYDLPCLNDPVQKVANIYGVTGVPETFIIDKNGLIVKKVIGGIDWAAPDSVKFFTELAAK